MKLNKLYLLLSIVLLSLFFILPAEAAKMYWTDGTADVIQRADVDDLVVSVTSPVGLDVDAVNGKVYWNDAATMKIQRSNLDGSNVEDVRTGVSVQQIVLDEINGKVYWTNAGGGKISRANVDGTGSIEDIVTGLSFPNSIDLDIAAEQIYFSIAVPQTIKRVNFDGTGLTDLITSGLSAVDGIAVEQSSGAPVPEPATLFLLGSALFGLFLSLKRHFS